MSIRNLLEIDQLTVQVKEKFVLDQVSFKVPQGKITAIVGGSGSGKTTIANAILRLLPSSFEITKAQIFFEHRNLRLMKEEQIRKLRGKEISMVFQEPLWAFDPLMTIGQQMDEVLAAHTHQDRMKRRQNILNMISKVELPDPKLIFERYPHQLSGGERQRAMIAQALVTHPKLIIADEPTSNLDVILQARIIEMFRQLKNEGMTVLLISHDLGMVTHLADQVVILEKGKVVESGEVKEIMHQPKHKYTQRFMEAFS